MRDIGLLYTEENRLAVIEDRKTMTRRLPASFKEINERPDEWVLNRITGEYGLFWHASMKNSAICLDTSKIRLCKLPYAVGDMLYIKEGIILDSEDSYYKSDHMSIPAKLIDDHCDWIANHWGENKTSVSPLFMPKWCARYWQRVTAVKVERLQSISVNDCRAEGWHSDRVLFPLVNTEDKTRDWYHALWDSIHGPGAWELNPWLVAVSFERIAR